MTDKVHADIRRTLLFLIRDGEILLAMKKRGFGAGKWNGVGGKLDPGETVEQATVRETQEEIDVTPLNYYQVAELDFLQDAETENPWHMYTYAYFCDDWQGEPAESEEMAPRWYKLAGIPYQDMWDDDEHWVPQVLAGHKVFGRFTFDKNDRMLTHDVKKVDRLPNEK